MAGAERQSDWTIETLKELIDSQFEAIDKRFEAGDKAVVAALAAAKEAVAAAFESSKEAIAKAETAAEKRFASVNEFRAQLRDQQMTLLPRAEADNRFQQLRDLIDFQGKQINELQRGESRGSGADAAAKLNQQNSMRITALLITTAVNMLGLIAALVFFLVGKH